MSFLATHSPKQPHKGLKALWDLLWLPSTPIPKEGIKIEMLTPCTFRLKPGNVPSTLNGYPRGSIFVIRTIPMPIDDRPTVYSTSSGDLRKPPKPSASARSMPPNQQTAYLHRESKGRGGKVVTLVKNIQLSPDDLKALSKALKQACGTGGTIKDGIIEIQGDHREKIASVLVKMGYKAKVAGG